MIPFFEVFLLVRFIADRVKLSTESPLVLDTLAGEVGVFPISFSCFYVFFLGALGDADDRVLMVVLDPFHSSDGVSGVSSVVCFDREDLRQVVVLSNVAAFRDDNVTILFHALVLLFLDTHMMDERKEVSDALAVQKNSPLREEAVQAHAIGGGDADKRREARLLEPVLVVIYEAG